MAANRSAAMHAQAGTGRRLADGLEPIYPAKTPERARRRTSTTGSAAGA